MTGFAVWTGCIHLLKCIKWKSSGIDIKRATRLRGFVEVMLFIPDEATVFFTVTVWPHLHINTHKFTHTFIRDAVHVCNIQLSSDRFGSSDWVFGLSLWLYRGFNFVFCYCGLFCVHCTWWLQYSERRSHKHRMHGHKYDLFLLVLRINCLSSICGQKCHVFLWIVVWILSGSLCHACCGNESGCNLVFDFPFFIAPTHNHTHT